MTELDYDGYVFASSWAGLLGRWEFDGATATYVGSSDPSLGFGLAVSDLIVRSGWIDADVTLPNPKSAGRIVFGHDPTSSGYSSAGVGGDIFAYYLDGFAPGAGWRGVAGRGLPDNLQVEHGHHLEVYVQGQYVMLRVDGVEVISSEIPAPLSGEQVGVIAWGEAPVRFENLRALPELPEAFVVMQYGEPFDSLYHDVIAVVSAEMGYAPSRADDTSGPGIILQDIIGALTRASVVIAEITVENPNVFYELGYAHALGQPTILLAERGRKLPFDISGYRCIFYDNTIGGKDAVEEDLRRHLGTILSGK